jgi:flagellar motility protein MotE (MotC chaperone)
MRHAPTLVLAIALAGLAAPASAQQGWAPVVVPADPAPSTKTAAIRAAPSPAMDAFLAPLQLAAQQLKSQPASPVPARAHSPTEPPVPQASPARQYCVNIANAAADARFAWQKKLLADTEKELEKRLAQLDAKTAELQKWVVRRDEFVTKARDNLVLIYSRMRAEAAAAQLVAMDEETAASVLLKLDVRVASLVLNEMDPAQAARLTGIIAGATKSSPSTGSRPGPEDKKS